MTRRFAMAAAALLFLSAAHTGLAEEKKDATKPKSPIDIEADQMEIKDKESQAVFSGNVNAKRQGTSLRADKLIVYYSKVQQSDGSSKTEVSNFDAIGGVVIVTDKEKITGDWAKMNVKTDDLVVGGNVTLTQGETVLRGQQLVANLKTDKLEMSGGRVKGSFLPK